MSWLESILKEMRFNFFWIAYLFKKLHNICKELKHLYFSLVEQLILKDPHN